MSTSQNGAFNGHVSSSSQELTNGNTGTPPSSPDVKTASECMSQLEVDARAAVKEMTFGVKTIAMSELLPRTAELLFVNLTSLEGHSYCLELTAKGWRVASNRHDCMNGDFRALELHTRYFETIYQLLDVISPQYRQEFGAALAAKLLDLQRTAGN